MNFIKGKLEKNNYYDIIQELLCFDPRDKEMLRPTVTKVIPEKNYQLLLEFNNGESKLFDVKPYIKGIWFGRLSDEAYFKTVRTNGFSIEWPDGQDICPDDLYNI